MSKATTALIILVLTGLTIFGTYQYMVHGGENVYIQLPCDEKLFGFNSREEDPSRPGGPDQTHLRFNSFDFWYTTRPMEPNEAPETRVLERAPDGGLGGVGGSTRLSAYWPFYTQDTITLEECRY